MICDEEKHIKRKMPQSSLGCHCAGVICVGCFLKDFENRSCDMFVTVNDDDENFGHDVSKWEDGDELAEHVLGMFEDNVGRPEDSPAAFNTYVADRIKTGKPCPFCCKTCIWRKDKLPHVSATTGKLTFRAPDHVLPGNFPTSHAT
jgi:hypothetical protein